VTFLELCKRLRQECGGSGSGPPSVTTATGEDRLWVDWINDAWLELQALRPDWYWMWEPAEISVVAGTRTYALASTTIRRESLRLDGDPVSLIDWTVFERLYGVPYAGSARPTVCSIRPDGNLVLATDPVEDGVLAYEHYRVPVPMAGNDEAPTLPARYQLILVYDGMRKYGFYDNAPEVLQRGEVEYQRMLARLARDTMSRVNVPGPLA
jgi:hypothetical protein